MRRFTVACVCAGALLLASCAGDPRGEARSDSRLTVEQAAEIAILVARGEASLQDRIRLEAWLQEGS